MATQYSVTFINNSSLSASFCLYQQAPDMGNPNVFPLAWFTKYVNKGIGQRASFTWNIDYCFVWGETGVLKPGVNFNAGQVIPADLSNQNQVTLDYNLGYQFLDQASGSQSGSLYIKEDKSVPIGEASVGIGMSGQGTFVQQAGPNLQLTFTPKPQYWCLFGYYQQGDVMDIQEITGNANISFPPNVYNMFAIMNEDNTWSILTPEQASLKGIQ